MSKQLLPYAKQRQKELEIELRGIKDKYSNKKNTTSGVLMEDRSGKLKRVPRKNVEEAQKDGYKLK